jgi:eukaryotic-like serine/threonine-protein kinase
MEMQQPLAPDSIVGRTIGNYIVRHKIGEGGMGSVYSAEHPTIGKRVALKVLHAEFTSQPEVVSRFFNEAKAVNDIQHPNIVDIIDFGTIPPAEPTASPLVYFTMEYIIGNTLSELIRCESPLPHDRVFAITLQIADALSASHQFGIVHRDLKPDNVMLVTRGRERDFVKLLDFGIAKLTGKGASTPRTRTGMVIGTPQYMSPEQCEGRGKIDHRADIYALGIVMYQMLTGKVPFAGEGFGEVLVQQMVMPPLAPSMLVPQIPKDVELVVLKALEKRAEDRYQRMDDLVLAIQDPARYVEAHGGHSGFLASSILRDPAAGAAVAMFTPNPTVPTPLGDPESREAGEPATLPRPRARLFVGLAGALAAGGVVLGLAMGGGDSGDRAAAPVLEPDPEPKPPDPKPAAPAPISPPPVPIPPPPVTAVEPKTIKLTIESSPPGATVTIDGDKKGTTPYVGELPRGTGRVEVQLTLARHVTLTRKIDPKDDIALSLALERVQQRTKTTATTTRTTTEPSNHDTSDDTKNPFDRIEKKGQP